MAVKYFCDRCGEEAASPGRLWEVSVTKPEGYAELTEKYDLCPGCRELVIESIEHPDLPKQRVETGA